MSKLSRVIKAAAGVFLLLAAATVAVSAQTLTTLYSFHGSDGSNPFAGLMQASNGNLYGTTSAGGANGDGTVFQITTSGTLTTTHNFNRFNPTDGSQPYAGLIQATDGNLYGTTYRGGSHNVGIVYRITTSGTMKTLHDLDYQPDGALPYAGLVQATNGQFYGTASNGGGEFGTAFIATAFGQYIPIYTFINSLNGANPVAGLVQASNGNLYGAADSGGSDGCGALFEMTLSGAYTMLHDFTGDDGCSPQATLVQGTDGNLYGTTIDGGAGGQGHNYGAAFNITPSGTFTLLHTFDGTDGTLPTGALIQANDGNFYGTTQYGGAYNEGTIFKMTPSGAVTTLYSFCPQTHCNDGANPYAGLIQGSDGVFYGTTFNGGGGNDGTVFSLSVGLSPIVRTAE
jgi:uncharacterized repeat protein (TIGR03803 family)